jgi:putative phosphoesterase
MKLGIISDLHIDRNESALKAGETFETLLSDLVKEKELEYLLIAGDISNHYEITQKFIEEVEVKSGCPVLFVPGNHDYWAKDHEVTDTNKINDFFNQQSQSLVGNPRLLGEHWAIAGNPSWYDYGYGNHQVYSKEDFERKRYKFASWNDRHYVDWGRSDEEVSSEMLAQLREDLDKVKNRKTILMTHVATHSEFVVPLPHRVYDYANAFLGAKSYETLYEEFPSIKYSVMGHVHFRKSYYEKDTQFLSACLGNKKHWRVKDVKKQLDRTLVTLIL